MSTVSKEQAYAEATVRNRELVKEMLVAHNENNASLEFVLELIDMMNDEAEPLDFNTRLMRIIRRELTALMDRAYQNARDVQQRMDEAQNKLAEQRWGSQP